MIFRHLREDVPNARQIEFFTAKERHVAYGGARGGGKSWAARRKAVMLCMRFANLKILLLRRTMPELRRNHINPLRAELYGYATYKQDERAFLFPNGARLDLGYCDNEGDLNQYQGQEYDCIFFEEATNFPEEWILFISTALRTTRKDFTPRIYYTMNPGGVGHAYMKRLFIDRRFRAGEKGSDYRFVPARVYDNQALMSANPEYVEQLKALPHAKRRAHLDGDWNVLEGQVFEEFIDDETHYRDRRFTHVIEPFEIPPAWRIYRSFDFGYAKPFSVGWWAADNDGRLYRILELYGCRENEANVGVKWEPSRIFREIRKIEKEHRWLAGKHITGVADPSIWDASRGESIAMLSEKEQVFWEPGDNKRLPGWMQMHYRLAFDAQGIPMLYVFASCRAFIRTVPQLQYDAVACEDVDTHNEDHVADECRYLCMMNPMPKRKLPDRENKIYNPLEDNRVFGTYAY